MIPMGATVATLRDALAPHFAAGDLDSCFDWMTAAGVLPRRNGGGGATGITPRQTALALIALATGFDPVEAPEEALRVAGFKLHSRSVWLPEGRSDGQWFTHQIALPEEAVPTFLDFVEQQIEAARGALPRGRALTFMVTSDEAIVQIPPERGGGMLHFEPSQPGQRPGAERGRGIGGAIIETVAGLFEPIEPIRIAPTDKVRVAAALGIEARITWH